MSNCSFSKHPPPESPAVCARGRPRRTSGPASASRGRSSSAARCDDLTYEKNEHEVPEIAASSRHCGCTCNVLGKSQYTETDLSELRRERSRKELESVAVTLPTLGLESLLTPHGSENPKLFWFLEVLTMQIVEGSSPAQGGTQIFLDRETRVAIAHAFQSTLP